MGCGTTCLKVLIIIINIVFGLIGLVLFGVGLFVRYGLSDRINETLGDTLSGIPGIPALFGFLDSKASSVTGTPNVDFAELLMPVSTALIVLGVILLVIAVCGAFGACCNSRCLMIVYCCLVAILLVAQVVLVILFFTNVLDGQIEDRLNKTIVEHYEGIDDYGIYSLSWNLIMSYFECCGLNGYEDFKYATMWNNQRLVNVGGANMTITLMTPVSCCKFNGTWPSVTPVDAQCSASPNATISNYNTGCYGAVSDKLNESDTLVVGVISAILVVQAIILIAGCYIAHSQRESADQMV